MEMQLNEMLKQVTEFIEKEANAKTVIGETFKLGEFSCVPVVKMGFGLGSGGGLGHVTKTSDGEGGGAGAGIGLQPVGFLVAKGDNISFIDTAKHTGLSNMFEKVPDLIEKYMKSREKETASTEA